MTLTQLGAFVLVARLGCVRAAADMGRARLIAIASQPVGLAAEAEVAVKSANGAPIKVGPSGTDPDSDPGRLPRSHRVPDRRISVFALRPEHRSITTTYMLNFLATPDAMQIMCSTGIGVPPSRFRPPVYVTIWS